VKSLVINLETAAERYAAFVAGWNAPFSCERVAAVDGERIQIFSPWTHNRGGCGLNLTYIWIFAEMLRRGQQEPFAVFEDDAMFAEGWWEYAAQAVSEAPPSWGQVNLGAHVGAAASYSEKLCLLKCAWRTHGVIYNPAKIADMIAMLGKHPIPVDQVWCHLMQDMGVDWFYATRKFLVGARAGRSQCTGTECPEFHGANGLGNEAWVLLGK